MKTKLFIYIDDILINSLLGKLLKYRPISYTKMLAQAKFIISNETKAE